MSEWKNLTDGSFKGFTFHVAVPQRGRAHGLASIDQSYERKLQITSRPGVDGSETSDFGRSGKTISAELVFFGPNYVEDLKKFESILNEGTPGVLTLPDEPVSLLASFQKISKKADAGGGNAKSLSVTWVEAEEKVSVFTDSSGQNSTAIQPETVVANASKTKGSVANAQSVMRANPLLTAIRSFESGLSAARSSVNTVLTLTDGVRNRIAALEANIKGTLSLANDAVNELTTLFGSRTAAKAAITFSSSVDPVTGQRVASYQEPDEVVATPDPLARPEDDETVSVSIGTIESDTSAQTALKKITSSLTSDRDEMLSSTGGRTDDVSKALTAVIANLNEMSVTIKNQSTRLVLVPMEMSLNEVLFHNGRSVDDVDSVHKLNTHIADPLIVPAGTVVVL